MLGHGNPISLHDAFDPEGHYDLGFGDPSDYLALGDPQEIAWGHGDPSPPLWILVWSYDQSTSETGGEILTLLGAWQYPGPYTAQLLSVPSGQTYPQSAPGLKAPAPTRAGEVVARAPGWTVYDLRPEPRPYQRRGGNPLVPPNQIRAIACACPPGLYDLTLTFQGVTITVARIRVLPQALNLAALRVRSRLSPALKAGERSPTAQDPRFPTH